MTRFPRLLSMAAAVIALAGCAVAGPADRPEPTATQSLLAPATAALREGNFAFTVEDPDSRTKGVVHLPSRSAAYTKTGTRPALAMHQGYVAIGPDVYVKLSFGTDENQWRHYGPDSPDRPQVSADDLTGIASRRAGWPS